jgi:phosphoribosyl 1,2-cyclic phosphodiesterase
MLFTVLGSGSKGNALYIESGKTSILVDAGFSGKELVARMAVHGKDPSDLNGIFLTHEHGDHIQGAGVLSRRYLLPVYANEGTFMGSEKTVKKLNRRIEFETGDICQLQDLSIRSFRISHDTSDPVGYLVSDGKRSVACCTDTGKVSKLICNRLSNCDALVLEFNHDPTMLRNGPYPDFLQQRVRSSQGHLANEDAANFLQSLVHDRLQHVVLAHLSETNNLPDIARTSAMQVLAPEQHKILCVARQNSPTELFDLQAP